MYKYRVIKMLLDSVERCAKQMVLLISVKFEKWRSNVPAILLREPL